MRKNIMTSMSMAVVFLATICFSSLTCLAQEVKLSKQEKTEIAKTLNVMFANFGERRISSNEFSNSDLIQFGIINAKFAPKKYLAQGKYLLPAKNVEAAVDKYFNISIKHQSIEGNPYKNGFYEVGGSDAGEGDRVELVKVQKNNETTIEVESKVFEIDGGDLFRKDKALLQKVTTGGKSRYVVLLFSSKIMRQQ